MKQQKYRFVEKKEYAPVKAELEVIIQNARDFIKETYGFSFQNELAGSGGRKLITQEIKGNRGFDFDYNLFVIPEVMDYYKAKDLKDIFIEGFRNAVKYTTFEDPQDSTTVIKIRTVEQSNSRVRYSCDFAIMCRTDDTVYCLKHHKENGGYGYEPRNEYRNLDYKLGRIEAVIGNTRYSAISDEYIKLKNSNKDCCKSSFNLYVESVNNIFNEICS